MSRHIDNVVLLGTLLERFETALNILTQVVKEAEGRPQWSFLQSRMTDLEARIGRLCEDTQVALFHKAGVYAPAVVPVPPARKRAAAAALEVA